MPLIDALMMAYTVEMISIEKVVTCVKRFSTFSASKELPFDLEDAMIFWINKVTRLCVETLVVIEETSTRSSSHANQIICTRSLFILSYSIHQDRSAQPDVRPRFKISATCVPA